MSELIERLKQLAQRVDDQGEIYEAVAEIERLTKENIDRLMAKGKLEDEIQRLRSSPTSAETDELIERLQGIIGTETITNEVIEALHRLSRNQITASHTTIAQAAAFQAQHADASAREADEQQQRAEMLTEKCSQFTRALGTALTLIDELMRENGRLCAASSEPPNVKLFTAKNSFDAAMKKLLRDEDLN